MVEREEEDENEVVELKVREDDAELEEPVKERRGAERLRYFSYSVYQR